MKKILLTAILAFCGIVSLNAVPAYPGKMTVRQPDGSTITVIKHGDEWGHWMTDTYGNVLKRDNKGFLVADKNTSIAQMRKTSAARRLEKRRRAAANRVSTPIALGEKHFLVILVEFKDKKFSNARDDFSNLLNKQGYSANGAVGSARDFYYDNSHGKFTPVFDVYGPVTLSENMAYYGGNDEMGDDMHPEEAVVEGLTALKSQIDFSKYDNDGDKWVDLVFMYYAGYGEADYYGDDCDDTIWPHQWDIRYAGKSFSSNGYSVSSYACSNELIGNGEYQGKLAGIGTACHEFGHAMGLPDFYDVDYDENGEAAGLFSYSTMDSGSYNNEGRTPPYFNIEERIILGWLDASAIREFAASGTVAIPNVDENVAYQTPTDMAGEYFLYECREKKGWDAYIPAAGLVVYHVDKSSRYVNITDYGNVQASQIWSQYNSINENGSHPCFYIVPAADQTNLLFGYDYYPGYGNYYNVENDPKIPFPGSENVTSYTPVSWNGVKSAYSFSNISYSAGNGLSVNVSVPSPELSYPTIANPKGGVYQIGDSFQFNLETNDAGTPASVEWYFDDAKVAVSSVQLTSAGTHTVEAAVSYSGGRKQIVTLEIKVQ